MIIVTLDLVGKYIIDSTRLRLSLGKVIYIPEEIMKGLGLTGINIEDLPLRIKFPGKLLVTDCRDYPCQGWACNVKHYNKSLAYEIGDELEEVQYTKRCFLGFDKKTICNEKNALRLHLKTYKDPMTFYVARIPLFRRYIQNKDVYSNSGAVDIATKEVIIESIVTRDYRDNGFISET